MTSSSGGHDAWRSFQKQLVECWVGEAVAHVAERAIACGRIDCVALLSIADRTNARTSLSVAFALRFERLRPFAAWFESHKKQLRADDRHSSLVVFVAPKLSALDEQEIKGVMEQPEGAEGEREVQRTLLLVIRDPVGLVDVDNCLSAHPSRCYELVGSHKLACETRAALLRPLEQLGSQCGLRFVLEIARWTVFKVERKFSSTLETGSLSLSAPPPMLTSAAHMPFQLLLQLLRWSHFHPAVVRGLAKPFERKLRLIPQARIRDAIVRLRDEELAIWSRVDAGDAVLLVLESNPAAATARPLVDYEPVSGRRLPPSEDSGHADKQSLSACRLWAIQKQFYVEQGILAWSDGIIPFGVSSSSFLAAAYARVVLDFFLQAGATSGWRSQQQQPENEPNCFVWEAASGSCKFLHAFLVHFYQLVDENASALSSRGIRLCVVASDLSDQVLDSRMALPCFQPFLSARRLDFARFDSSEFIDGCRKRQLRLKLADRAWHVGRDGPVFLMGNYFLDSLRADVFAVASERLLPPSQTPRASVKVYQGRVDPHIVSIGDLKLSFRQVEPASAPVYDDPFVNQVLLDVLESIEGCASPATASSALILFPVEAIQLIRTLVAPDSGCERPVGLLFGDASFSFRDPISSAFFSQEDDGAEVLEIPQLSPHPDCFCLPVDFEILRVFLRRLGLSCGHEFASFTPSDCDLLWGMMGVDNGAVHFSLKTLVALLAQSAWDFDLFAILQWTLMRFWRRSTPSDALRLRLASIANKCWATYYVLENEDASHPRPLLQHSRWLYLTTALQAHPSLTSSSSICYVLGLAFFKAGDLWRALASFRKCVTKDLERTKFKRRVALTLLALQSQKLAEQSV
ncbi:hypothetical protein PybrP1_000404 [[Pythium] brassicae (nom. inval.)]|nr:hypothetical protein PybrP1_000404 [[Pythium] brassicae (nom. inval.)]